MVSVNGTVPASRERNVGSLRENHLAEIPIFLLSIFLSFSFASKESEQEYYGQEYLTKNLRG